MPLILIATVVSITLAILKLAGYLALSWFLVFLPVLVLALATVVIFVVVTLVAIAAVAFGNIRR